MRKLDSRSISNQSAIAKLVKKSETFNFVSAFLIQVIFKFNYLLKKLMTSAIIANIKLAVTPKLIFYLLYNDRYYLFEDVDMMFLINLKLNMIY